MSLYKVEGTTELMEGDGSGGVCPLPVLVVTDSCSERPNSLDTLSTFSLNRQRRHSSVDLKNFFGIKEKETARESSESNDVLDDSRDTLDCPQPSRERRRSFSGFIQDLCSPSEESKKIDDKITSTKNDTPFLHRQYEFEVGLEITGFRERSHSVGELKIGDNIGGKFKRLFTKTESQFHVDQRQNGDVGSMKSCTLPAGIRPKYETDDDDDDNKKRWSWGRHRVSQLLDFNLKSLFTQEKRIDNVLDEGEGQDEVKGEQSNGTAVELSGAKIVDSSVDGSEQSTDERERNTKQSSEPAQDDVYDIIDEVTHVSSPTTEDNLVSTESPKSPPKLKRNRFAVRKRHGQKEPQITEQISSQQIPSVAFGIITKDEFVEFYNQVVRTLLHPLGKFDCSGISPLELISHLQKVLNVDQARHSSLIKDQVNKLPDKVILKLRVIEAKDLKPMDPNGLSDPYFIISLGSKSSSRSGTLDRKSSPITPQLEKKTLASPDSTTPPGDQLNKEGSVDDSLGPEKSKNKKQKTIGRIKSFGKGDTQNTSQTDEKNDNDNSERVPSSDGTELKKENVEDSAENRKNKKQKKMARTKSSGKGDSTLVEASGDDGSPEKTTPSDQIKKDDEPSDNRKNKKPKKVTRIKSSGKGDISGKSGSVDGEGEEQMAYRTTVAKETLHPIWNEVFLMEVTDVEDQQLQMFLWDWDEDGSLWNVTKTLDRKHKLAGVQTIFRHMKQTMEHGKSMDDFMGQFNVSLSDISASSRIDAWYKIKKHSKGSGHCRLQMQFVMKSEDEDNTVSHVVMYYKLSKAIHKFEGELALKDGSWNGTLSDKSKLILALYAVQRGLTHLAALTIDLAALLDFFLETKAKAKDKPDMGNDHEESKNNIIDEVAIREATLSIHAEKLAMSSLAIYGQALKGSEDDVVIHHGIQAPDPPHIFESSASLYVNECLKKLDNCPAVFPPTRVEILDQVKAICRLDSIQSLLKIKFESVGSGILRNIQSRLESVMKEHTRQWLKEVLQPVILPEGDIQSEELCDTIEKLNEVIRQVTIICRTNDGFKKFFSMFQVDYFVVVSEEVDQSLSKALQNVLSKTDSFLLRHKKIPEKVNDASIATLKLYMTVKLVRFLLKQNVPCSDRLDIMNFHDWFQNSLIFWIMTFRYETFNRVQKALEMDKDVKLVHAVVKYSNSAVDVKSCFAKVTEEWQNINFGCIDSRVMAITKITLLICDGANLYADRLHGILAENGFYEGGKDGNFDIKDKLCITLNNIEHVRAYLDNLPSLLNWERNVEALAKHHQDENAGRRTHDALQRLTRKTSEAIVMRTAHVEQQIAERMCIEVRKSIRDLVNDSSKQDENLDAVLQYLDSNLQTMYNQLMPQIFPRITKALWVALLRHIVALMKTGKEISYYKNLKSNLDQFESYFQRPAINLKNKEIHTLDYAYLSGEIEINLRPTEQLLLKFFAMLGNDMVLPKEDWGYIEVQLGTQSLNDDKAVVHVKILNATNLPGMDADGTSDPFVLVELRPETMFHKNKTQKTRTISSNLNPVFNEPFEFHVSKESLTIEGTVLQLTVMDHDLLWYDDFIGEVFIPLDQAQRMRDGQTIDQCNTKILPIKRPHEEEMPVCYQVLKERSWDRDAKAFTTQRQMTMKMKKSRTDKPLKLTPNNSVKKEKKDVTKMNTDKAETVVTTANKIPTITIDEPQINGGDINMNGSGFQVSGH